jgi:thiamine-monophosphate kinase
LCEFTLLAIENGCSAFARGYPYQSVSRIALQMGEFDFISRLREFATHPAARGLCDDAAVLEFSGGKLILTQDTLVEGVHFLPDDPPESIAWKLLAVNLSDLAAKGGHPLAALMSYTLRGDDAWDAAFADGLAFALRHFGVALIGGDTVSAEQRQLSLTLIGETKGPVPARSGARAGDALFVTGTIGDAGYGLELLTQRKTEPTRLTNAYRKPQPQLAIGQSLAPVVTAMMDISDGLLIDVLRLADASGVAAIIDLDAVPLSDCALEIVGGERAARLVAATAGDDYQLLFTSSLPLPPLCQSVTRIGQMSRGTGLSLFDRDGAVPLPTNLGWVHEG